MKKMVIFDDYTGLPRAWAIAPKEEDAEKEARRQLESYCAKNKTLEPWLANPADYTKRVLDVTD